MKVESVAYSVSGLDCRGQLIYDDSVKTPRPLLLVAPNWAGITPRAIEMGKMLAGDRYVVMLADMYGEGKRPTGKEVPMEFLAPLSADAMETRRRIVAGLDAMTQEAEKRGIGDVKRRAAFGYCFGGANVLDLARSGADVAAVVSFHGNLKTPIPAKKGDVKAVVLVVHGSVDPIAPKSDRDALEEEMTTAGACWNMLTFGGVCHSFTDDAANRPGVSQFNEPAMRHGYNLAHAFIDDAFAGKF
jgi:dienelactone hydrolase